MAGRTMLRWPLAAALVLVVLLGATSSPRASEGAVLGPMASTMTPQQQEPPLPPAPREPRPNRPKLEGRLAAVAEAQAREGAARASEVGSQLGVPILAGNRVRVIVESEPGGVDAVKAAVQAAGGTVEGDYRELVQAALPIAGLATLEQQGSARYIRLPFESYPAVVSEGLSRVGTPAWHTAGYTGQGVKVAIIDSGFAGYQALVGSELPSSVVVRSFRADGDITGGGVDHGTAVAEIVRDVAPGAQLYLVNTSTEVELGNAVDWLISEGVRVINRSVGSFVSGPGDGTGPLNDIVAMARAGNILWVNAAGNHAGKYWQGVWSNPDGNEYHNFGGAIELNTFILVAGECVTIYLSWNDWPWSNQDYDLELWWTDPNPVQRVRSSTNWQTGSQPPVESLVRYCSPITGTFGVAIRWILATRAVTFRLFVLTDSNASPDYITPSGSLLQPADSPNALTVGAVRYDQSTLESFSSRGPTQDGRTKPDLVGPDGVSTATKGPFGASGTSFSAPHIAGAAALVLSRFPSMSAADVQAYLEQRATDMGASGKDNLYGSGMLTLPASAVQPVLAFAAQPVRAAHGRAFGLQPAVALRSASGVTLTADSSTVVTLTIKSGTGASGATLACNQTSSGATTARAASGVATFSGCIMDRPGWGYVLVASAAGLTATETAPFNVAWAGDTNGDCRVSILDYSAVVTHFGKQRGHADWLSSLRAYRADQNGDGVVDVLDHSLAVTRFGTATGAVQPQPSGAATACPLPSDPGDPGP